MLREAWTAEGKPVFEDVIGRKLKWSSVRGCELLKKREALKTLQLKKTVFNMPNVDLVAPNETPSGTTRREPATSGRGPVPTVAGYWVTRTEMTSYVYVLNFEGTDIFKVGWASDVDARAKDINQHVPSEILQRQWEIFLWRRYPDQFEAYAAEQKLLTGPSKNIRLKASGLE
jgi:hypothetical protein